MEKIKVYIDNRQKTVKIPSGLRLLVRRSCNAVLVSENFEVNAEVNVTFVDDAQIKELTMQYRQKNTPSYVLSFPMADDKQFDKNPDTDAYVLGDIVISLERAAEQAERIGQSLQREVAFLTVHSMLHILGYAHEKGGIDAIRMHDREDSIMTALGFEGDLFEP